MYNSDNYIIRPGIYVPVVTYETIMALVCSVVVPQSSDAVR